MAGVAAHGSATGVRQSAADDRCRARTLLWKRCCPTLPLPGGPGVAHSPCDGLRRGEWRPQDSVRHAAVPGLRSTCSCVSSCMSVSSTGTSTSRCQSFRSHPLQRHSLGRELWQEVVHVRPDEPRQGVPLNQEPQLKVYQRRWAPVVGNTWWTGPESTGDTLRVRRGEVGPQAGTVVLYGRDVFYCQLDYWLFYNEGHKLYLTPNGVVLSYVDVPAKYLYFMRRPPHEEDVGAKRWNKRQQQSREERGSVDPESSSDAAAGRGSMDPAPGAGSSSDPGRGSMDPAPGKARKGPQAKGGREGVPSEPPQPEPADTENLRKSIDEAERQQSRRRMEANETVEVDLSVNTAKVHVEQQEALLRQTSSNPWFLFNQDVLALKDATGNKIYSDYGDARARVLPGGTCQSAYELSLEIPRNGCSTPSAATVYTSFCVRLSLAKWRATF